jgi:uncharacterized protein
MQSYQPSKMIRVYFSEADRFDGRPLYEVIVERCRALNIAGATVFRGVEGFGGAAEVHRSHMLTRDSPVMITIVDTDENMERLVPEIEEMIDNGLVVSSDVNIRRVNRGAADGGPRTSGLATE